MVSRPKPSALGEDLAAPGRIFLVDHDLNVDALVAGVAQQAQEQAAHAGLAAGPAIREVVGGGLEQGRAQVGGVTEVPEQLGRLREQPLALPRRRERDVLGLRLGAEHGAA